MPKDIAACLLEAVDEIRALLDPSKRARAAQDAVNAAQAGITELGQLRRDAMTAMLDGGLTQPEIAKVLDLSPERVRQLMAGGPRPARAVLGSAGKLTAAIGGKFEAEKQAPVLSTESFAAYELLADLARTLGLDCGYEVVPPPGLVDLNRPNLIVIGSPRILPFLTQVLPADTAYGWDHDDNGWFLVEKASGNQHRSPADSGDQADYAYVGRLPRPDGAGTFLYLAGIHAPGTLGAAAWLVDELDQIHRETRGKRWSVLLEVQYDRNRKVKATSRLTPLIRQDGHGK